MLLACRVKPSARLAVGHRLAAELRRRADVKAELLQRRIRLANNTSRDCKNVPLFPPDGFCPIKTGPMQFKCQDTAPVTPPARAFDSSAAIFCTDVSSSAAAEP